MGGWQFWIDRGGTFTDVVAKSPSGEVSSHKLLSVNPDRYDDAALQGIRDILGLDSSAPLPISNIDAVKMGTTVATNALLERQGTRTVLAITSGLSDALRIGSQNRPRLFDRNIILPDMLYERVIEIDERLAADGTVRRALDETSARSALEAAYDEGYRAIAVVLMHAYRYPAHEQSVATLAQEIGFTQISVSHDVAPLIKLISRGDTTVADAYLTPILRQYVDRIADDLDSRSGRAQLMFMQSNGGLTDAKHFQGRNAILSGPAGGVVGAVKTSVMAGFEQIIGFDMGGTSTDVCHFDGTLERAHESIVGGVRLKSPMMRIHTVAAGGGSILHFRDGRYQVGPDSAGADPGPAAYRKGGPLTVTDCNIVLGKIQPTFFPTVFGEKGNLPLDRDDPLGKFETLSRQIEAETGNTRTAEQVAEGFLNVAVQNMASAIKVISVQRGYDVTSYTLCAFGAAAGQHACLVADALAMNRVFLHPLAGVLSAYGMGLADRTVIREQSVEEDLSNAAVTKLSATFAALENRAKDALSNEVTKHESVSAARRLHVRYKGTDTSLLVGAGNMAAIKSAFEAAHAQQFGFTVPDRTLVIEAAMVELTVAGDEIEEKNAAVKPMPEPAETVHFIAAEETHEAPLYSRETLGPGHRVPGPAIIVEPTGTVVIELGWTGEISPLDHLVLTRTTPRPTQFAVGTSADPVLLEIFNNLFMSIAEQMGSVLENTSHSVNIKERLDFSCAVFDTAGNLIANAPHMPVHLGSMGESVRTIVKERAETHRPGDVFVLNAPYAGGTHLPDVTVITPVFQKGGKDLLFYVASRGHHADIGGTSPGSMPPDSRHIEEEGVLIENFQLVREGLFLEAEVKSLLTSGKFPVRNLYQNIADLQAQIAANHKGVEELHRMIDQFSLPVVQAYMRHVRDNAAESVRRVLDVLADGSFTYPLDDGALVQVTITIDKQQRRARVDFTGTSPQQDSNFNAPSAVCRAAVLYVFRTLVDADIPMNEGCLEPLELVIPDGSLLAPHYPAAVVAGNVETSQIIVDCLYGALGVLAASQGTMNNFTFGNDRWQYYETICGGAGAGPGFDGASAVHTHMTNSRLTDPEILEWRFPVMLDRFEIRAGSGGAGHYQGGDGIVREIRFLEQMEAAILSSHRVVAPFGVDGGEAGARGINRVRRNNGTEEILPGAARTVLKPEDVFVVETPGGGGFGRSDN